MKVRLKVMNYKALLRRLRNHDLLDEGTPEQIEKIQRIIDRCKYHLNINAYQCIETEIIKNKKHESITLKYETKLNKLELPKSFKEYQQQLKETEEAIIYLKKYI